MVENSLGKPMWVKTEKSDIARYQAAEKAIDQLLESAPVREEFDVDSELPHLAHEAWNALAKLELYLREKKEK